VCTFHKIPVTNRVFWGIVIFYVIAMRLMIWLPIRISTQPNARPCSLALGLSVPPRIITLGIRIIGCRDWKRHKNGFLISVVLILKNNRKTMNSFTLYIFFVNSLFYRNRELTTIINFTMMMYDRQLCKLRNKKLFVRWVAFSKRVSLITTLLFR